MFLNVSHRFSTDPEYGEIMRRFRIGKVTLDDLQRINTRYYRNSSISFASITKIRCACYMNNKRNAYNDFV